MNRCQFKNVRGLGLLGTRDAQCDLPEGHLCDHVCLDEPLGLILSLAWKQEIRLQLEAAVLKGAEK